MYTIILFINTVQTPLAQWSARME